jgi:hypothetical protein
LKEIGWCFLLGQKNNRFPDVPGLPTTANCERFVSPCGSSYLPYTLMILPNPKATIDKPNKDIDPLFAQPIRTTHPRLNQFERHIRGSTNSNGTPDDSYEGEHEIDATTAPKSTSTTSSCQAKNGYDRKLRISSGREGSGWVLTAEGDAVGRDNAGLDDGVLLPGEGLAEEAHPLGGGGPHADEEEAEQPRGDIEGGDDPRGEVELHDYDAEHDGQQRADDECPQRELLPPRRHGLVREHPLHGRLAVGPSAAIAARPLALALARVAVPQGGGCSRRLGHLILGPAPASSGGVRRHLVGRSCSGLGLVFGARLLEQRGRGWGGGLPGWDFRKKRKGKKKRVGSGAG